MRRALGEADRKHILIIDDDDRIRSLLAQFLNENNFIVSTSSSVEDARLKIKLFQINLMILDIMMPGEDGLSFLKSIRGTTSMGVLVLTAKWEINDRIEGLELGADDYLTKPFNPKELLLRIQSILRRVNMPNPPQTKIKIGEYIFDWQRRILTLNDAKISLTTSETNLLAILAIRVGRVVSRDEIVTHSAVSIQERNIDVQMTRLRKKIERNPNIPEYIVTVRNGGYVLWGDEIT
jgi:two-component system phosphate regulon response regulator OmpR